MRNLQKRPLKRKAFREILANGKYRITMTPKRTGERRSVVATLNEYYVTRPEKWTQYCDGNAEEIMREVTPGVVSMFDVEQQCWRQIHYKNIVGYEQVPD